MSAIEQVLGNLPSPLSMTLIQPGSTESAVSSEIRPRIDTALLKKT
jgi:hypothetical protein